MPQLEEMTAWSLDEIEAEIRRLLPKGWRLNPVAAEGYWQLSIESPEDPWHTEWLEQGVDRRILSLSAYGWLWLRDTPTGTGRWSRRQDLTTAVVGQHVASRAPDPEDLDPAEITALVQKTRK